jgi:hypothetical protein
MIISKKMKNHQGRPWTKSSTTRSRLTLAGKEGDVNEQLSNPKQHECNQFQLRSWLMQGLWLCISEHVALQLNLQEES